LGEVGKVNDEKEVFKDYGGTQLTRIKSRLSKNTMPVLWDRVCPDRVERRGEKDSLTNKSKREGLKLWGWGGGGGGGGWGGGGGGRLWEIWRTVWGVGREDVSGKRRKKGES